MAEEPNNEKEKLVHLETKSIGEINFVFSITEDKRKLFLECQSNSKEKTFINLSRKEFLQILPSKVAQGNLEENIISDILEQLKKNQNLKIRRIAKGKDPLPSRDGRLLLLVKSFDAKNKKLEFIDPWYIKHFDLIEENVSIARIYPPIPGQSGEDVFGNIIPAPQGKSVQLQVDKTVEVVSLPNENYQSIITKLSGYLEISNNKLSIIHDLNIAGDCDHTIGDLEFPGNILVKGSVKKDFSLTANGNIEIQGDAINAFITSRIGDIKIKGYVTGSYKDNLTLSGNITTQQISRFQRKFSPQIKCAGNFSGSTLDNVSIEAMGAVYASKEIKACYIRTRAIISCPNGSIIGGELYTVCGLEAKCIGAESGTYTTIHLTSDIESSAEYLQVLEQIKSHESAENVIRLYLGAYAENPSRIQFLKDDLKKKMQDLFDKLSSTVKSKEVLLNQKKDLLEQAKYNSKYLVNSSTKIYPGVIIKGIDCEFRIDQIIEGKKSIEYFPAEKRFEITNQTPLVCDFMKVGIKK